MIDLDEGFYWLKNITSNERVIFRPIRILKLENNVFQGTSAGTYVQMLGDEKMHSIHYINTWKGVDFIKLKEPK